MEDNKVVDNKLTKEQLEKVFEEMQKKGIESTDEIKASLFDELCFICVTGA